MDQPPDRETQSAPDLSGAGTLQRLRALLDTAEAALAEARIVLSRLNPDAIPARAAGRGATLGSIADAAGGKVVEGTFDGQNMLGPDRKQYSVPANYASKSKLVEGDTLKLTITPDGSFVYKQIGPVERKRIVGTLARDEVTGDYRVLAGGRSYRVLLASITYYKGEVGDEVVVLVPKEREAHWAAVENVIKHAADAAPVADGI